MNEHPKLEQEEAQSDEAKYINTKLLFPLRQRITDLQQQLIVNQQGVLMFEVLVENKTCRVIVLRGFLIALNRT